MGSKLQSRVYKLKYCFVCNCVYTKQFNHKYTPKHIANRKLLKKKQIIMKMLV